MESDKNPFPKFTLRRKHGVASYFPESGYRGDHFIKEPTDGEAVEAHTEALEHELGHLVIEGKITAVEAYTELSLDAGDYPSEAA